MKNGKPIEFILGEPYLSADNAAEQLGRSKASLLEHARKKHLKSILHKGGKYFKREWLQDFVNWRIEHPIDR